MWLIKKPYFVRFDTHQLLLVVDAYLLTHCLQIQRGTYMDYKFEARCRLFQGTVLAVYLTGQRKSITNFIQKRRPSEGSFGPAAAITLP